MMSHAEAVIRNRHVAPFEPGFVAAGTRVLTPSGMKPIADLKEGEKVVSHNRGATPIVGIKTTYSPCSGFMQPIALRSTNSDELVVSPTTLLMVKSSYAELYFGSSKVLVRASSLRGSNVNSQCDFSENLFVSILLEHIDVLYMESFLIECRGTDEGSLFGASADFSRLVNQLGQYPVLDDDEAHLLFNAEGGAEKVLQSNNLGETQ